MFGTLVRLQGFVRRGSLAGLALVSVTVITACGSSSPAAHPSTHPSTHVSSPVGSHLSSRPSPPARAESLLRQTFAAQRRVQSGVLTVTLALTPSSPAGGADPISISLEGPFRTIGDHRPPAADYNISVSAGNRTTSLAVVSTGGASYLTTGSDSYQLPASSAQMLESPTAKGSTTPIDLSTLGVQPQGWLVDPRVVGSDRIGGVTTTRIHAKIDAEKLVADLSTLLPKASSLGLSSLVGQLPKQIPAATQRRIAAEMRDPYADIWTGSSDRILRKLILSFELPAGARLLGKAAGGSRVVTLTLRYSDLNRPQTIARPAKTQPHQELQARLAALALQLGISATSPGSHGGRAKRGGPPELTLSPYAQCIANAAPDVAKMHQCAALSNGASPPIHKK